MIVTIHYRQTQRHQPFTSSDPVMLARVQISMVFSLFIVSISINSASREGLVESRGKQLQMCSAIKLAAAVTDKHNI